MHMNGTFGILLKFNFVKFGEIQFGFPPFWSNFGAIFGTKVVRL